MSEILPRAIEMHLKICGGRNRGGHKKRETESFCFSKSVGICIVVRVITCLKVPLRFAMTFLKSAKTTDLYGVPKGIKKIIKWGTHTFYGHCEVSRRAYRTTQFVVSEHHLSCVFDRRRRASSSSGVGIIIALLIGGVECRDKRPPYGGGADTHHPPVDRNAVIN